ncbi:3-phosphoserine/phosphohydroxythreonine transaminase [Aliiglaciecola sp. LCG003]|uniref:3-phosphoserine/phosphohydroxythreonine transaminase n=1 Tax=Aliiglaciecola sp. LCG003 TaxID=3053655 RepID=UPI002573D017|nr:3-phosphoserine/phosphohydroxythreonine transaminase [Aliiglaciecola sp. LCG003]WJG11159.1 3-phosphoserine/phosphohydroxythreonine transaminase [Aliiglaciecola sp. LCG003]
MTNVFNFSAGPAMLPADVMQQAQQEFINWQGQGCSVMEMSHRSKAFIEVAETATDNLRKLLSVPKDYHILFTHGGGRGQFSAVPLNLTSPNDRADHLVTGSWSKGAVEEASHYLTADVVGQTQIIDGKIGVQSQQQWQLNQQAAYFHYCPNETVEGIEIPWVPETNGVPIVADMSSNILSKKIDVSQYGVIYAGAQKNIGPSGLSVVIVHDSLLDKARTETPSIINYSLLAKHDSMYNTPPTFAWYLAGLVFKWLLNNGGVDAMEHRNADKAALLYDAIDSNDFYSNNVAFEYRSRMNVPFHLATTDLDGLFLKESEGAGLKALKGHRIVGGMRASIYNAMPIEGVQALVDFMHDFAKRNG